MATKRNRLPSGTLQIRIESGKFLLPDVVASRISNMVPTSEGTLRSIQGPTPYLPYYPDFIPDISFPIVTMETLDLRPHGLFHAVIKETNRDILLYFIGPTIWEFRGWEHGWYPLIGSPEDSAELEAKLFNNSRPQFPTQFEATDQGIIIVPQGSRAYFYDGKCVAPLGYDMAPGPPTGHGPNSSEDGVTFALLHRGEYDASAYPPYVPDYYLYGEEISLTAAIGEADPLLNNKGYRHDAQHGFKTAMHKDFGTGRVGTVEPNPGDVGVTGIVLDCRYRAAIQWIDRWGNLSPVSGRSNEVYITEQPAFTYGVYEGPELGEEPGDHPEHSVSPAKVDLVLKQIAWSGIEPGPERTIGRTLARTKDLDHSGTSDLFKMRAYAQEGGSNFATIPDNCTTIFPDNVPDSWLFIPIEQPVQVPLFKLTRIAFGRHFIANMKGEEGLVRWSMPSRWGTFLEGDFIFPDSTGETITGLWRAQQGLLVFTSISTYIFVPNASGDGFKSQTVSAKIGCVAASSLSTLADGRTVWLGQRGFYIYDGNGITLISDPIDKTINTLNKARIKQACAIFDVATKEYRCWVPRYGSKENDLCLIYDGVGWRERTDIQALAACVTRDHRHYTLVAGKNTGTFTATPPVDPPDYNVWLLDHQNTGYDPDRSEAIIETAWLTGLAGKGRSTALTVYLWLRETKSLNSTPSDSNNQSAPTITIEVARDWREATIETVTTELVPADDSPPLYDETLLGTGSVWTQRRPFWVRAMIYVPSCETFKLRLKNRGDWEFVGLVFDEQPKKSGGARIPITTS